jgi:hypothetical protein
MFQPGLEAPAGLIPGMVQVPGQMRQRVTVAQDPRIFLQAKYHSDVVFFKIMSNPPKQWLSLIFQYFPIFSLQVFVTDFFLFLFL